MFHRQAQVSRERHLEDFFIETILLTIAIERIKNREEIFMNLGEV